MSQEEFKATLRMLVNAEDPTTQYSNFVKIGMYAVCSLHTYVCVCACMCACVRVCVCWSMRCYNVCAFLSQM